MSGAARGRVVALVLAGALAAPAGARADAPPAGAPECRYKGDRAACFPYGCVPVDASGGPVSDPDLVKPKSPGRCGMCTNDDQCGGTRCRMEGDAKGTCTAYDESPAPRPFRPAFGLLIADLSFNFADSTPTRPIVSVGFFGQLALGTARPAVRTDGKGFILPDPPRFYADLGASAAFAGPSQNLFVTAGLTYYVFNGPLALSTVSADALYQRQGTEIWQLDTTKNRDRLGPALTLGFMQNLYLRGAYVFGLVGPDHHGAVILSLLYMRDLFDELVSDRFRKYLPKALQSGSPPP
jgi:hypothetical protein